MLSVTFYLFIVMLNVIILSVVMLNVIMLSVVAPLKQIPFYYKLSSLIANTSMLEKKFYSMDYSFYAGDAPHCLCPNGQVTILNQ
jgi:hypothetical protein